MKKSNVYWVSIFTLIAVIIAGCKKTGFDKIASQAWSPNLAVPLAIGEFSVYDVLANADSNFLTVGPDGALAIVYSANADIIKASEVLTLPDQDFNFNGSMATYGVPVFPFFSGTETYSTSQNFPLNSPSGASLFTIDFRTGILTIDAETNLMHSVKYDFTFPDLTENGVPVSRTINLIYSGSLPQTGSATVNLDNSILDLTNGSSGSNEIRVDLTITVTGSGSPITGTEYVDFNVNMQNLDYDLITGNVGTIAFPNIQDTIGLSLFNNTTQGSFTISNPKLEFKFTNSFGLPVDVVFNSIKTKETNTGNEINLSGFPPSFSLQTAPSIGQSSVSTFTITDQNSSNFQNILSPTPKVLIYDIGGSTSGNNSNFITHDSKINLEGTLTLPLEGYATGFMIRDTIVASINLDNEFVESAMVRLNIDNGFPLEAGVRILLVDENYVLLKDLTNGFKDLIKAAPVNSSGRVTQSTKAINDFTLTNAELPVVKNTKYIIFEVGGQTYQGNQSTIVKFYDDYKLKLRLGMQAIGKVNL
ncbi:MAG: hypothetical protein ACSHXL_06410 [Bacteroidota bacterium]